MIDKVESQASWQLSNKISNTRRALKGNALREYKQSITLNTMQREVIVGTLLGDASIPLDRGKSKLRVQFAQTIASADYIQHLYDLFKDVVGTPPRVYNIRGGGARDRQSIWFKTYSHPEFKFYDEIFYPIHEYKGCSRKKRVHENIHELLTPKGVSLLVHGRWLLYVQQKSNL